MDAPSVIKRESATKKTLKNINPLMLDFLKNLEVLKHSSSIPFAYFKSTHIRGESKNERGLCIR